MNAQDHLDKAAAFIAVAESGDAKIAAYVQAADEIIAAQKAEPGLSLREVDRRLGRGVGYARMLVRWRDGDRTHPPFGGPARNEARYRQQERQVPTEPEDRVDMAHALLEDEAVVEQIFAKPSLASRRIERAVEEKQAAQRQRDREDRIRLDEAKAVPLPAYVAAMLVKLREWKLDVRRLRPYLDELTEREQQTSVADAHRALIFELEANVVALDPPPELGDDVIDGTVHDAD